MKSTNLELLKGYLRKDGVFLHLSQVVVEEVKNKHKEQLSNTISKVKSEFKVLKKISETPLPIDFETFIQTEIKCYSDFIDKFLIEYGVTVEDYPTVTHQEVVQRALNRQRPFKVDGKDGYRDYLIWQTVLWTVKTYLLEQVFFVTFNTRDFSSTTNKNDLHPDLVKDMELLGIDPKRLHYFISLDDFIQDQVKPHLLQIEEQEKLITNFMNDQQGFLSPLENYLVDKLQGLDISSYKIFDIPEYENPSIESIDEISSIELTDISKIDNEEYLIKATAMALCNVKFFIRKSDFLVMDDDDKSQMFIVNTDWNKHYILAEIPFEIEATLEIIYKSDDKVIQSLDIIDLDNPYSDCIYCD